MDRALNIPEFLQLMLDETDSATTAAASRTCRGWHGPALSSLWCRLDSILPIVLLFGDLEKQDEARSG